MLWIQYLIGKKLHLLQIWDELNNSWTEGAVKN